jgi:dienelactone hydrolase
MREADQARAFDDRCGEVNLCGYPAADGSMMRAALYHEPADRRAWASMQSLFDQVLT